MTRALPFTIASLSRAIKGVEAAGRFVVGVRVADGILIVGDKPVDTASFAPEKAQTSEPSARRFGDKLNGDQSDAARP
jgi:20S proteasome alpha/beta subunit